MRIKFINENGEVVFIESDDGIEITDKKKEKKESEEENNTTRD